MDVIEIKRDWAAIDRPKICCYLSSQFYGRWPRIIIYVAAAVVFVAGMEMIKYNLPSEQAPNIWLASAPIIGAIFVGGLLNRRWSKKLIRALDDTPLRRNTRTVFLSKNGVSDFGPPHENEMTWRYITDVVEYKDLVLLLISPVEFIPLQDSGLPSGLTRADLLEKIARWREVAAP